MAKQLPSIRQIIKLLVDVGLGHISDKLITMAKPCLRMETLLVEHDTEISIGASKMGGHPDLPGQISWPRWNDIPLSFLCQICLREASYYKFCQDFPKSGWLYFFYDPEQRTWGFDPADFESWRVIYYEGKQENLSRCSPPNQHVDSSNEEYSYYEPCRVMFSEMISMPGWEEEVIRDLILDRDLDKYIQFTERNLLEFSFETDHKLFGHPDCIQGPMSLECQLVSNGIYCGDTSGYSDHRREMLESGVKDWEMLLQIDTDDATQMIWGDCGRLYFWIRRQDLASKAFEKAWMILQCS